MRYVGHSCENFDSDAVIEAILVVIGRTAAVLSALSPAVLELASALLIARAWDAATAVHRLSEGMSIGQVAVEVRRTTRDVRMDARRWAAGPPPHLERLALNPMEAGLLAIMAPHFKKTLHKLLNKRIQRAVATLSSLIDTAGLARGTVLGEAYGREHEELIRDRFLSIPANCEDLSPSELLVVLNLGAGRPLGPLTTGEFASPRIRSLFRHGLLAGIDSTEIQVGESKVHVTVMAVGGYPVNVAIGLESEATAIRLLRLVVSQLGGAPYFLSFDGHLAYTGGSFGQLVTGLGIEPHSIFFISENPVETINGRLKAHLPHPELLTLDNFVPALLNALAHVQSERESHLGNQKLRSLDADQRRLFNYESIEMLRVEGGHVYLDGEHGIPVPDAPHDFLYLGTHAALGFDGRPRKRRQDILDLYIPARRHGGKLQKLTEGAAVVRPLLTRIAAGPWTPVGKLPPQLFSDVPNEVFDQRARLETELANHPTPARKPDRKMADQELGGANATAPAQGDFQDRSAQDQDLPDDIEGVQLPLISEPLVAECVSPSPDTTLPLVDADSATASAPVRPSRSRSNSYGTVHRISSGRGPSNSSEASSYDEEIRGWAPGAPRAVWLPTFGADPRMRDVALAPGYLERPRGVRVLVPTSATGASYGQREPLRITGHLYLSPPRGRRAAVVMAGQAGALLERLERNFAALSTTNSPSLAQSLLQRLVADARELAAVQGPQAGPRWAGSAHSLELALQCWESPGQRDRAWGHWRAARSKLPKRWVANL